MLQSPPTFARKITNICTVTEIIVNENTSGRHCSGKHKKNTLHCFLASVREAVSVSVCVLSPSRPKDQWHWSMDTARPNTLYFAVLLLTLTTQEQVSFLHLSFINLIICLQQPLSFYFVLLFDI